MDQLPVELHIKILNVLASLSWQDDPLSNQDPRSPSLFPFNVASVCTQWLAIVSEIPECWTRVIFDVAKDPTPFLDAFLWSEDLEIIEVLVFTSSTDDGKEYGKTEKQRSIAITQALRPHVHRCKSITFDITYSTSLPPAHIFFLKDSPYLEKLVIECAHDDIQIEPDSWMTTVANRPHFGSDFSKLKKLSLTGFSFLYFALHLDSPESFAKFQFRRSMELYVSRFTFLESGHYTVTNFMRYFLHAVRRTTHFHDLSLSNEENWVIPTILQHRILLHTVYFQSVSKDFITSLYATVQIFCAGTIAYKKCEMPNIGPDHALVAENIILDSIIDDERGTGLRHILAYWIHSDESSLTMRACTEFNDSLLSDCTDSIRAVGRIYIQDCTNFTPSVLREFVRARNALPVSDLESRYRYRVKELFVTGRGPRLTKKDKDWFLGQSHTKVQWITQNDEEVVWEEFSTPESPPTSV